MQVEPALHQLSGVALEIAPVIVIGETCGGDPRPRRQASQGRPVRLAERPVDGLEFVILVLAQWLTSLVLRSTCRRKESFMD